MYFCLFHGMNNTFEVRTVHSNPKHNAVSVQIENSCMPLRELVIYIHRKSKTILNETTLRFKFA